MQLMISEILEQASQLKTKQQKIEFLRRHYSKQLHFVVMHAFDPRIKFLLPEEDPSYTPLQTGEGQGMLYSQARKLYLFLEGSPTALTQLKREMLFIQLLESIDPKDATLLLSIKNKKLPYKTITEQLIKEAFGDYNG